MITLQHNAEQFAPFLIESILHFQQDHGHPKGKAVSLDEKEKQISIHFNLHTEIDKMNPVCDQFEFKNYASAGTPIWFCQFIDRVLQLVKR